MTDVAYSYTETYKCRECHRVWSHTWTNEYDYTNCPSCGDSDFDEIKPDRSKAVRHILFTVKDGQIISANGSLEFHIGEDRGK